MKKNIFFLSLILLLSIASGSCKRISNKNESKEVILASFTVLADLISNVAKDDFIVTSITKGVEEPDFDFIKKNSEKIVEKAFEKEKINWKGFISDIRKPLLKLSFGS